MSIDSALSGIQSITTTIQSGVNVATRAAADVGLGGVGGASGYWKDRLQQASYFGVPFGVMGGSVQFGRRNVVHQYPDRDTVWVEDLGRSARRITMTGFLVENPRYAGVASVIEQRQRLMAACEMKGDGELVHPTLGRMTVSNLSCSSEERWDQGRVFALSLSFIESGKRIFPGIETATGDAVETSCSAADFAGAADFATSVSGALKQGAAVVSQAVSTAAAWARKAQRLVNDATNLYNMVGSLPGAFGRFFGIHTAGLAGNQGAVTAKASSVAGLIAAGAGARANVSTATANLTSAAGSVSATSAFAAAAQAVPAALLVAAANPADGIRLLSGLADFAPSDPTPSSPIGTAMATMQSAAGDLFRRAAAVSLARASAAYQPSSADDAATVQAAVCAVLDGEITIAGDQGQDATFSALRLVRAAVVRDLSARGAALATITTITTRQPVPAPVLALRLYRDASRGDELVQQANPPHPAFMPIRFKALAK